MPLEKHQPYYNKEGIEIPSVTTLLKLLNKPELVPWANWLGKRGIDSTEFTEKSAFLGTLVHYIIERMCGKKFIDLTEYNNLSQEDNIKVKNCLLCYKEWNKFYDPKFIHNELKLNNGIVGGTVDGICEINNKLHMVDFKTSKKVYPTYFIQLAGYNYLLKETTDIRLDYVSALILPKNKPHYDFNIMPISYLESCYEPTFLLLLDLYYKWSSTLKEDWNESIN